MKLFSLLAFMMTASSTFAAELPLSDLLPINSKEVTLMGFGLPRKGQIAAMKLQNAMASHPDIVKELVSKRLPGEPLPYDKRLGLSRAAFDEALSAISNVMLMPVGKSSLTIKSDEKGGFTISSPSTPTLQKSISIQADKILKLSEERTLGKPTYFENNEGPLAGSRGYSWSINHLNEDTKSGKKDEIVLSKLKDSTCLLSLTRKVLKDGVLLESSEEKYLKYKCSN